MELLWLLTLLPIKASKVKKMKNFCGSNTNTNLLFLLDRPVIGCGTYLTHNHILTVKNHSFSYPKQTVLTNV